jgi:hypothetical protein
VTDAAITKQEVPSAGSTGKKITNAATSKSRMAAKVLRALPTDRGSRAKSAIAAVRTMSRSLKPSGTPGNANGQLGVIVRSHSARSRRRPIRTA